MTKELLAYQLHFIIASKLSNIPKHILKGKLMAHIFYIPFEQLGSMSELN